MSSPSDEWLVASLRYRPKQCANTWLYVPRIELDAVLRALDEARAEAEEARQATLLRERTGPH